MNISFGPKGTLQIDNARIIFRNFKGEPGKYNREGERNFAVIIPNSEIADELSNEGWNVKIKPPHDEDESPFMYLPIKLNFNGRGPSIYLESGPAKNKLDEETVGCLDDIDIVSVSLDVRPYDWVVNGKTGRAAYLQSIWVTQEVDRFARRYAEEEHPEE